MAGCYERKNKHEVPQIRFFKNWKRFTDIFVDQTEEMRKLNTVDIIHWQELLNKEEVMGSSEESITCTPLYKPSLSFLKMC